MDKIPMTGHEHPGHPGMTVYEQPGYPPIEETSICPGAYLPGARLPAPDRDDRGPAHCWINDLNP